MRETGRAKLLTHGRTTDPEYHVWAKMHQRCRNPRAQKYPEYGGRGIRVCERWSSYLNFIEDMGRRPSADHQIDRINNDGHYEPGNCRWATRKVQQQNRGCCFLIAYNGTTQSAGAWAKEPGIPVSADTIRSRLKAGWAPLDALLTPPGAKPD